jgi:hypothetical protein
VQFDPFWALVAVAFIAAWVWLARRDNRAREAKRALRRAEAESGIERPGLWERLAAAWREDIAGWKAYRASFVFREVLGSWPKVRHIAPGVLVMKAPYIGPRRVQSYGGWKPPVLTGVALGVLNCLRFGISAKPEDLAWVFAGAAIYGGLFSIPFWRMARKTRLVIRFDHGAISWKGPDKLKHVVRPEEPRSMQVMVPHRWGPEEARKHADWRASHPGQPGPKPLFQTSSELVMNTGPGGGQWRTVAEFCNDGSGEQAHRLQSAIDFVTDRAAEELAALLRAAAE